MNPNLKSKFPKILGDKIRAGEWIQQCDNCQKIYLITYPFYIHNCSCCKKKCCLSCLKVIKHDKDPIKNIRYCLECLI